MAAGPTSPPQEISRRHQDLSGTLPNHHAGTLPNQHAKFSYTRFPVYWGNGKNGIWIPISVPWVCTRQFNEAPTIVGRRLERRTQASRLWRTIDGIQGGSSSGGASVPPRLQPTPHVALFEPDARRDPTESSVDARRVRGGVTEGEHLGGFRRARTLDHATIVV